MNNLHREPLGGGVEIYVTDSYHFTTDTVLLADFSQMAGEKSCVDLGAGCGTIGLLWLRHEPRLNVCAVELQEDACGLIRMSAAYNHLERQLTVLHADLKELRGKLPFGAFDMVACNPPYKPDGTGLRNPGNRREVARHETECTLDDVCQAAANLLQFGGRFCLCQRTERLADAMESMRRFGIEPKRLRLVQQRRDKAPKLFLLEGRRGGKRGFLDVLPTLFIEDENGDFSEEMMDIYGDYKSGHL